MKQRRRINKCFVREAAKKAAFLSAPARGELFRSKRPLEGAYMAVMGPLCASRGEVRADQIEELVDAEGLLQHAVGFDLLGMSRDIISG